MTFRKVSAGRGAGWIVDGLAVFKDNPGAFLGACLVVGVLSALPLMNIVIGLTGVFFYGGLVSALHTQAQNGTPQVAQAFDGFRRPGAVVRLLPIFALNLCFFVVFIAAFLAALWPLLQELGQQGTGAKPTPEQVMPLLPVLGKFMLALIPVATFVGWITLLSVPRAMLDEVPGGTAMREAVSALFANFGALLVNLLCLAAIGIVTALVLMIPVALINVVAAKDAALGTLLQIPVFAILTGMIYALYSSVMYQAWRELFASDQASPPPLSQVEL